MYTLKQKLVKLNAVKSCIEKYENIHLKKLKIYDELGKKVNELGELENRLPNTLEIVFCDGNNELGMIEEMLEEVNMVIIELKKELKEKEQKNGKLKRKNKRN